MEEEAKLLSAYCSVMEKVFDEVEEKMQNASTEKLASLQALEVSLIGKKKSASAWNEQSAELRNSISLLNKELAELRGQLTTLDNSTRSHKLDNTQHQFKACVNVYKTKIAEIRKDIQNESLQLKNEAFALLDRKHQTTEESDTKPPTESAPAATESTSKLPNIVNKGDKADREATDSTQEKTTTEKEEEDTETLAQVQQEGIALATSESPWLERKPIVYIPKCCVWLESVWFELLDRALLGRAMFLLKENKKESIFQVSVTGVRLSALGQEKLERRGYIVAKDLRAVENYLRDSGVRFSIEKED